MNYHLLRYACFGYVGMILACAPVSTQVGSNEAGSGGSSGAGTGGAGATSPIDRAQQMMREKYPECANYISASNPQIKNGIIFFDCGAIADGPSFYYRLSDGSLISLCGGACMLPDEPQRKVCQTLCPPPEFGDCVAATGTTAALPPCAEVNVCMSDYVSIHSTSGTWACQGIDGSSECRGTGYQSFVYDDDQVQVQLFFDNSVVGNYSTETFRAALNQYIITLKLPWLDRPLATTRSTADFTTEVSGTNADDLNMVYADGKLTLDLQAKPSPSPYFWIDWSGDDRCITDDMVGLCVCSYPVRPVTYVRLTLPVQQPQ